MSKRSGRRRLLAEGSVVLSGLAVGARSASGQTFGSTRPEGHARDLRAYGERSRFVTTARTRLGNKVNMNMHGDPNGNDALTPLGEGWMRRVNAMLHHRPMNPRLVLTVSTVVVAIASGSCSRAEPGAHGAAATDASPPTPWSVRVEPVQSPAGAESSEPQMTVSDRGVLLSWIERTGRSTATLKFAERTASGWTAPTTVSSGDNWFVSYADPPVVLRRPDGTLVANWLESTNKQIEGSDL